MKLDARAQADLRGHIPRLLSRARSLLKLPPGDEQALGKAELKRAVQFVSELHQGLVGERTLARSSTYDQAAHLGAYLLWWWPQSYARTRAALEMIPDPLPFLASRSAPVRILDLGAGPGPAALAIADWLIGQGHRVEALLADESEAALGEAKALAANRPGLTLRTERLDLARAQPAGSGPFELISAAHVLLELPGAADERASFLRKICGDLLAPDGALVVLEPALRETGRALLEVRDRLLGVHQPGAPQSEAAGAKNAAAARAKDAAPAHSSDAAPNRANPLPAGLRALAPCLTQMACPALLHPRDWCTAEIDWEAPPHILQLSRELGLHAEAPLSFAPMLLARDVEPASLDLFRVVGMPPAEKGKRRLFVCNDRGRLPVVRLDRDEREHNRVFADAARGDLLVLKGLIEKGDGLRLTPEAAVARKQ